MPDAVARAQRGAHNPKEIYVIPVATLKWPKLNVLAFYLHSSCKKNYISCSLKPNPKIKVHLLCYVLWVKLEWTC